MLVTEQASDYFAKAEECLAGAESEFINERYNNCANRCYYGCFHAAITALLDDGITPPGVAGQWGHNFVQAQFVGRLINRDKIYPTSLRLVLEHNRSLRETADYSRDDVTGTRAARAVRRTEGMIQAVRQRRERKP